MQVLLPREFRRLQLLQLELELDARRLYAHGRVREHCQKMPRQGRQPAQLTQQPKRGKKAKGGNSLALAAAPADQKSTSKHSAAAAKPGKKATRSSANGTAFDGEEQDLDAALDVYNYAARVKRPRGDVDPLARASFGSKGKGKGKGKARAQDHQEDEDMSDEDGSNDDEDEEGTGGFRVRGNEVVEFTGMKPAGFKLGMDSGDEGGFINSDDDDEEIDSDLAEDEDDEEDLPRLKRAGGSSKGKGRQTEIDLDEDEIDYDDEEGEGWMDLADVLDAGGYGTADSEEDDEEGAEDGESRAASSDEDMSSDSDDEGYDPDALDKLDSFVSGLDSKKRKSRGDDEDDDEGPETASKKKRAVLKERTEAYPEGEFTAVKPMDGSADGTFVPHSPGCRKLICAALSLSPSRKSRSRRPPLVLLRIQEPAPGFAAQIPQASRPGRFLSFVWERKSDDHQLAPQSCWSARGSVARSVAGQGRPRGGVRGHQGRDGQMERDGPEDEGRERTWS